MPSNASVCGSIGFVDTVGCRWDVGSNSCCFSFFFHSIASLEVPPVQDSGKILTVGIFYRKTEIFPRDIGRKIGEVEVIVMPAIMMVFILQVVKKQSGRFQR